MFLPYFSYLFIFSCKLFKHFLPYLHKNTVAKSQKNRIILIIKLMFTFTVLHKSNNDSRRAIPGVQVRFISVFPANLIFQSRRVPEAKVFRVVFIRMLLTRFPDLGYFLEGCQGTHVTLRSFQMHGLKEAVLRTETAKIYSQAQSKLLHCYLCSNLQIQSKTND